MKSAIHTYFIQNGLPVDRRYYLVSMSEKGTAIYEVMRLIEGVPLFLEDHYRRLQHSAKLVDRSVPWSLEQVRKMIRRLVESNRVTVGNIKVVIQWDEKGCSEFYTCFIPYRYPTKAQIKQGVDVCLAKASRENPNAKTVNDHFREKLDRLIKKKCVYESLLVNAAGFITEGSRSNFFAIRDGQVLTPPLRDVLPGVTRMKVLDLLQHEGVDMLETGIHYDELPQLDAAFLTGTSPGVLPIANIESVQLRTDHRILRKLTEDYEHLVLDYVRSHHSVLAY